MKQEDNQQDIYQQKQKYFSSQCAIHALNNIVGQQLFTKSYFDLISAQLKQQTKIRHNNILGGDYDINVIQIALIRKGYQVRWIDSRNIKTLNFSKIYKNDKIAGFLVNKQQRSGIISHLFKKLVRYSGRHWLAIRIKNGEFYQLDSQKEKPQKILQIDKHIKVQVQNGSKILYIIKA